MATNTFERKIELTDTSSLKRLLHIMNTDAPEETLSQHPFSDTDRERSEQLLKQCLSHSNH